MLTLAARARSHLIPRPTTILTRMLNKMTRSRTHAEPRRSHRNPMRTVWLLTASLLAGTPGCAQWHFPESFSFRKSTPLAAPDRVVPMWTDTVLYEPGQPGVRGFGARLYFYGSDEKTPIKVDGTLIVYAFDANDPARMPIPEKKFIFTPEQLAKHHSKTSLGDSYSIWIPWDEVGGPTRQLSLVTRFESSVGGSIVTDPARKLLSGIDPDSVAAEGSSNERAARVSFETGDASPTTNAEEVMPSISIDVPPSFSRKLSTGDGTAGQRSTTRATRGSGETTSPVEAVRSPSDDNSAARDAGPSADGVSPALAAAEAAGALPYHERLSTHLSQRKSPARSSREPRPAPAPLRRAPHHARWLSGLPLTPRSSPATRPDGE